MIVWIIVDKFNIHKRLRLKNGDLTPAFYSPYDIVKYYEDHYLEDKGIIKSL